MTPGIVSNCWAVQLADGMPIESLIEQALGRDHRCVELRQGALGRFERGEHNVPDAAALAQLPRRFPDVQFNVALAVPFFSAELGRAEDLLAAGIEAARAVAGRFTAQLRLVDPHTSAEAAEQADFRCVAENIAALAQRLVSQNGILLLENARQPWQRLLRLVQCAHEILGGDKASLGLCYDPCNLLMAADRPDPQAATRQLNGSDVAMVHCKQARDGRQTTALCPGQIDWAVQIADLESIGCAAPTLLEIPPHAEIWEHLAQSARYLNSLAPG